MGMLLLRQCFASAYVLGFLEKLCCERLLFPTHGTEVSLVGETVQRTNSHIMRKALVGIGTDAVRFHYTIEEGISCLGFMGWSQSDTCETKLKAWGGEECPRYC